MKKNYIILTILLLSTIFITLFLASLYNKDNNSSFAYGNLNKIRADEFGEYLIENPDAIFYIGDKNNYEKNKFEKKFINKLEDLNLLDFVIYIEKEEVTQELKQTLKEKYSYNYKEESLPIILVINDSEFERVIEVTAESDADDVINYEVFK